MKTISILAGILMAILAFSRCSTEMPESSDKAAAVQVSEKVSPEDQVLRGAYLVNSIGCSDCHSPKIMTERGPEPDPGRLLSGHPAKEALPPVVDSKILQGYVLFTMGNTSATGPWGTSFAANLTPDNTGLGAWSYEQFEKAMREGKYKGLDAARPLLPPMPWPNYRNLSDEDLRAIWAYLRSIPPVRNIVPAAIPPMG